MIMKLFGVIILLLICDYSLSLEFSRQQQRYNPNTDFLLHESGSNPNGPKRDYVATPTQPPKLTSAWSQGTQQSSSTSKRDYDSHFPSLGPTTPGPTPSSGKRDYVAPQYPALRPTQGQSQPTSTTKGSFTPLTGNTQSSPGRRDYMNPQFPALRPHGNVKDLINFYDSKGNTDTSSKAPSYSSILQAGNNKPGTSSTNSLSFSAATAGSSVASSASIPITTPKTGVSPTTPLKPTSTSSASPTSRPGISVLPSSIVNRGQAQTSSSNTVTDTDLQVVSEEMLSKDTNNAARLITINYQGKTTSQSKEDKAPLPLLTLTPEVWNIPTIQKFVLLLDNYERDTLVNEYVTPQEKNEENAFMDAIMTTSVIRHLMSFLKDKGYVTPDPKQQRDFLKQMWFGMYSRGKGKISSSGFEHVFVSELKNSEVIGLHNWIYFAKEEAANKVNYLGYMRYASLNDKGAVIKFHMSQQGVDKPVNSLFIGTSPELEMALYTLCFVTRTDTDCKLKLGGNDVTINTYNFRYRSKNYIGSAFPTV